MAQQLQNKSDKSLIIYQKYLNLIYYSYDLIKKYPKSERFVLCQETKQNISTGFKIIMHAQKEYNKAIKIKYLNELDISLNILKIQIRLAYRYKYITIQNYTTWSDKITDICNLLGAWISSCLKK